MATRLPDATQQASADAAVDRVDAGTVAASGKMRWYSGAQPASANDAASGTLIAEFTLPTPAYGAADANGAAALLGTPHSVAAAASGTLGWFRVVNRDDAAVFDGSITATGGGGDITVDNTSVTAGQTVNLTGHTYTQPSGE